MFISEKKILLENCIKSADKVGENSITNNNTQTNTNRKKEKTKQSYLAATSCPEISAPCVYPFRSSHMASPANRILTSWHAFTGAVSVACVASLKPARETFWVRVRVRVRVCVRVRVSVACVASLKPARETFWV